ncbi:MAG TPA: preprotein translocase subunit SecG [Candidatus Acidoferrum sp.]|nr:preprotein translocase subunit SecG [Candidatus Acidoferrum sp.]
MKWTIALLIGFAIIYVGFHFSWGGYVLTPFFVLNCLVLIIVVLLQSGKAADLAGAFGGAGSQTAFGPRGAATILSQATTWCAVMFMVCALAMVVKVDTGLGTSGGSSILEKYSKPAPKTAPAPVTPAPAVPQSSAPAQPVPSTQPATPQGSTPAQQAPATPAKP